MPLRTIYLILGIVFMNSCRNHQSDSIIIIREENGTANYCIRGTDTLNSDRMYFYKTGEYEGCEKFQNGRKHGHSYFFYPSGNMRSHWIYYEGHPDGYCYNYGDSYDGYPMEFLVYGGTGGLVLRKKYDSSGVLISTEGEIPKEWNK